MHSTVNLEGITASETPAGGPRCHECGTQEDLLADSGVVMCPECFEDVFPELEKPSPIEEQ